MVLSTVILMMEQQLGKSIVMALDPQATHELFHTTMYANGRN
jgi:hypothetical protein